MATGITLSVQYGLAPVSEAGTRLGQTAGHHKMPCRRSPVWRECRGITPAYINKLLLLVSAEKVLNMKTSF